MSLHLEDDLVDDDLARLTHREGGEGLVEFEATLRRFRERWNAGSAAAIVAFYSPEYQGSYAHQLDRVDVSTRATVLEGWETTLAFFRGHEYRFEFEDMTTAAVGSSGMLNAGWLRFYLDGEYAGACYRMEVWRHEDGAWRLLRDHQEYGVRPDQPAH